jgi:hypothetical protein
MIINTHNLASWPVVLAFGLITMGSEWKSLAAAPDAVIPLVSTPDAIATGADEAAAVSELTAVMADTDRSSLWLQPFPSSASASACTSPFPGLVAWYQADGNAQDSVGGNHGILTNGAGFVGGRSGQAFSFDGTNEYVATQLDVSPAAMEVTTWEAWVYPTRLSFNGRQQILSDDNGGFDRSLLIETKSTNFGVFTGHGVWMPTNASPNEWQHVVVVFALDHIDFYKNGVRFLTNMVPGFGTTLNTLQIGRNPGYGEYFQGLIDEVAIYRRVLSPDEIQSLYQSGSAARCGVKPFTVSGSLSVKHVRDQIEITWPALSLSQVLQTSGVMGPSAIWVAAPQVPVLQNGYYRITLTSGPSNSQAYYRLKGH